MATQSGCAGGGSGKYDPATLTFQAEPNRMYEILAWYAKIAALASKTLPDGASTPPVLPPNVILTLVGCSTNPTKKDITGWIKDAYTIASSFFQPDSNKGAFDITCPLRLTVSYDGTNFGFRFEDNNKRLLTVVISPIVCPLAGQEINTYCVGYDQWKTYTDGACGQYYQMVKANSEDCGYVPPIPAGEKLETYCEGTDQWAFFSDGNYGKTPVLIHEDSEDCGYVAPPVAGTVLGTKCKGKDLYDIVADGNGGTRDELNTPESTECGFDPTDPTDPAAGTKLSEKCVGSNLVGVFANGSGGSYEQVITYNAAQCVNTVRKIVPVWTYDPWVGIYNLTSGTAEIEYKTVNGRSFPQVYRIINGAPNVSGTVSFTDDNFNSPGDPVGNWTPAQYAAITRVLFTYEQTG